MNNTIFLSYRERMLDTVREERTEHRWVETKSIYRSGVHTEADFHAFMTWKLISDRMKELGMNAANCPWSTLITG